MTYIGKHVVFCACFCLSRENDMDRVGTRDPWTLESDENWP